MESSEAIKEIKTNQDIPIQIPDVKMFTKTANNTVSWKIIRANKKTIARVNAINHILKSIPYDKNLEI